MRRASENTLTHLIEAMQAQRAVTIRYRKPVQGGAEISRRKIEIHAIEVSRAGDVLVQCYDHLSGSRHTFRVDRILEYTLHRTARHARYSQPTTPVDTTMTDAEDAVVGFRAWDFTYELTA